MLTEEENARFMQTGKGTPMGELLRRYWHPVAAVTEFDDKAAKPVRLMGEDLVLYRDRSGTWGLLGLHCAHRRADLSYGFVEECGLRCSYHGWAFDEKGNCLSQPFEDTVNSNTRFRDAVKQPAYPVQEMAGLLFAYLGPEPTPLLPYWELFDYKNGFAQIVLAPLDCNWLQAAENNVDPVHVEWLHRNWSAVQAGKTAPYSPTHLQIDFDIFDHGIAYKRLVEGTEQTTDESWRQPRLSLLPNIFMPGGTHFEYRVPIDDDHTLSVVWAYTRVPIESEPYVQERIPHWDAQITDPVTGRWISTHTINQDTIAWIGQGIHADRTKEHLGHTDQGVLLLRDQLRADMEAVARGEDPKGVVRDPAKNNPIRWPDNRREAIERGRPRADILAQRDRQNPGIRSRDDYFQFYAGQPEEVRKAYESAMGL